MKEGVRDMKEARLILATETRDGKEVDWEIRYLLHGKLASAFGGFTETHGKGGYIMASGEVKCSPQRRGTRAIEAVWIYDIAMADEQYPALTALAQWLCLVAQQETVYVRRPDGEVLFYGESGVR